jgi:hypothetical protein
MDVILAFLAFAAATLCVYGLVMMLPPSTAANGAAAHGAGHGGAGAHH